MCNAIEISFSKRALGITKTITYRLLFFKNMDQVVLFGILGCQLKAEPKRRNIKENKRKKAEKGNRNEKEKAYQMESAQILFQEPLSGRLVFTFV